MYCIYKVVDAMSIDLCGVSCDVQFDTIWTRVLHCDVCMAMSWFICVLML